MTNVPHRIAVSIGMPRITIVRCWGLLLLSAWLCLPIMAQPVEQDRTRPAEPHVWVEAELGNAFGIGLHGSYRWMTAAVQRRSYRGPTQGTCANLGELITGFFGGRGVSVSCAHDELQAVSALVGATSHSNNGRASVAIGLGRLSGRTATEQTVRYAVSESIVPQLCVPIEVRAALHEKYFGVGVFGFANLNGATHFFGGGITLLLGNLR